MTISYKFEFLDSNLKYLSEKKIDVNIHRQLLQHNLNEQKIVKQKWCDLDFHQCSSCPLKTEEYPQCPLARDLSHIIESFKDNKSFEKVRVSVSTEEREYSKITDLQTGLFSLFGLVMASGECPSLKFLRPLVRFHLPFASVEETHFRILSLCFLREYFNGDWDSIGPNILEDLKLKYEEVSKVNAGILKRINNVVQGDANKNALVGLDLFIQLFSGEYSANFESLRYLFENKN
jgi:hypothetical protein